jgi:hypothetical protein
MGLFDRFRRKDPAPRNAPAASAPPGALAMVLLREPAPVDGQAVVAHLRGRGAGWLFPGMTGITQEQGGLAARIPGGTVNLRSVPAPVPLQELERPVALAWHWPAAREEVAVHRGRVMVHTSSTAPHPDGWRLLHERLVAAVLATTPALGVYVPGP